MKKQPINDKNRDQRFATKAIHTGQFADPTTGATIPPVYLSTTYTQESPGVHKGYEYSRSQNPTREALESCLAGLEEGEACAAFSSGLAATNALLQSLRPGDGFVAGHDLYGGTVRLLEKVFRPWGLEIVRAESTDPASYENALNSLKRPRMVWLETPTNPMLDLIDITSVADVTRPYGTLLVVDNTFASPYLQQPLKLGADLILHSMTKYLGGHSDVIGGALVAREPAQLESVRFLQNAAGAVPGPLDCYLVLRGLKTLEIRMERHCANAMKLAEALRAWPGITRVLYPGLPEHPGHDIARKQMRGFGGMISIELEGGFEPAKAFCSQLNTFSLAESLGGVESLASHPATMTHASLSATERQARGISDGLVRLSVGIEDIQDLLNDIEQALPLSGDR